jgi:DNA segregation ATPase FtsK/SpoIIIE-like protein
LKSAVGLDQKRQPTLINFGNTVTPHMMIAGTTGSGKTNAEQLLVRNLAFLQCTRLGATHPGRC